MVYVLIVTCRLQEGGNGFWLGSQAGSCTEIQSRRRDAVTLLESHVLSWTPSALQQTHLLQHPSIDPVIRFQDVRYGDFRKVESRDRALHAPRDASGNLPKPPSEVAMLPKRYRCKFDDAPEDTSAIKYKR